MALGKSDRSERDKIISELDKNLLVSASAGSGKTTILVERMVALVESGRVNLSHMAALTFTKKAANEFYDRFYKKLQKRIKPGFKVKKDDPYSLLNDPTPEAVIKDKEALKAIDTCFFGTIDAFYQKILNEHPLEAGLSSSAKIIDDDELSTFLVHKFSEYLESEDKQISEEAKFFAEYIGAKNFPLLMVNVLNNAELEVYQIADSVERQLEFYSKYLISLKKLCDVLFNNETYFRPYTFDKKTQEYKDKNKDNKVAWDTLMSRNRAIQNLKDDDIKSNLMILKKITGLIFNDDEKGLLDNINDLDIIIEEHSSRNKHYGYKISSNLLSYIKKYLYIRTINFVKLVKEDIRNSLKEKGMLTFAEATIALLDLLRKEDENRETIEQIRSKIDCLLIDECQDTDIKQYEIFFRLAANDFNEDFTKLDIDGGKLYACGDRKQGIYHFRGADVTTYDKIKDLFLEKHSLGLDYDVVNLTDNFRSKGSIIKYFNSTFEVMLKEQGYSPVLNDDVKPGEEHYGTYSYAVDAKHNEKQVADLILKLMKEKPANFKDFMIITANKESISTYAKEFSSRGIPCYSEGNVDVNISALSNVVVNIFKYISSEKKDTIALMEILVSPLFNFDPTQTINIEEDYLAYIGVDYSKLKYPSELLEQIASNRNVIKALNCKGIDVLIGFIHLLKEEEYLGHINSYSDAIKYFSDIQNKDKKVERLSLLANTINAVQIANAHKTKGLEKPIVIVTKAGTNNAPSTIIKDDKTLYINSFNGESRAALIENPDIKTGLSPVCDLVEKEKAYGIGENLRLLYVVATRARDYLYMPIWSGGQNKWKPLMSNAVIPDETPYTPGLSAAHNEVALKDDHKDIFESYVHNQKTYKIIAPSKIHSSNKFDEDYEASNLDRSEALIFGTMVHKLLENIIKAKQVVLDTSICEAIAKENNAMHLCDNLEKVRKTIYDGGYINQSECPFDDLYKEAKESKCYTEVPFSYRNKETIVNGFIDLIMEKDDEIIVIDYKTDVNEIDHKDQLRCYEEAIKNSGDYNGKKISSYIYHIVK